MSFGENLRFLRKRNKLSQDDLATALGYRSFTTIQKWETNQVKPSDDIIDYLAHIFRVTPAALVSENPISESLKYRYNPSKDPLYEYRPFIPLGYALGCKAVVEYEGKTTAQEPFILFPDGETFEISNEELEDIIEDAIAVVAYRLDKLRRQKTPSNL